MPNEIDIAGLRESYKDFEGVEIPFHLHDAIRALPALLDEIERLRGIDPCDACKLSVESAEAERDALKAKLECLERSYDSRSKQADELNARVNELKAKMERVREWAGSGPFSLEGMPLYGTGLTAAAKHVLNILDGKEG